MGRQISLHLMALLIHSILCSPVSAGVMPPYLEIESVEFPKFVYATQSRELGIKIKNTGAGDAHNVTIKLETESENLEMVAETSVPSIPRGGTETVKIQVTGGANLSDNTEAKIDIRLIDGDHKQEFPNDKPRTVEFETRELELVFDNIELKTLRTASETIEVNHVIHLRFHVSNKGEVTAHDVKIKVENKQKGVKWLGRQIGNKLSKDEKELVEEHPSFGKIERNTHKVVNYLYHLQKDFNHGQVRFTLRGTVGEKTDPWMEKEYKGRVSLRSNWLLYLVAGILIASVVGIVICVVEIRFSVVKPLFFKVHTWGLHWWKRFVEIMER